MTESTHDLIAAKAARMRELLRRAKSDADDSTSTDPAAADEADDDPDRRSWGNWTN